MQRNVRAMGVMIKHLDDEYEVSQLNPVWAEDPITDETSTTNDTVEQAVEKLPEAASLRLRIATMEAIVDQMVEDAIEENPDVTSAEITEEVEPVVDKAVELALVPASTKQLINATIARHLRRRNPKMQLLEKCATFMTAAMTRMEEDDTTVDDLDSTPGQENGDTTADEVANDGMQSEIKEALSPESDHPNDPKTDPEKAVHEEIVEKEDVAVESELPLPATESMKFLAASVVNTRKAKALVIRNISGAISAHMLHQLRYCLPARFKRKYGV